MEEDRVSWNALVPTGNRDGNVICFRSLGHVKAQVPERKYLEQKFGVENASPLLQHSVWIEILNLAVHDYTTCKI